MTKGSIGILAGMGPRSTTPFLESVLDQCQIQYGARYDMDYPHIMIYSLPTPFFLDREIDHSLMKLTIIDGLRKLESTGVSFIAMPCNSAHIYFEELKNSIKTPLLNIVEETVSCLPDGKQRITILATETTYRSELYQRGIISAGHEVVFLEQWQVEINNIINAIKLKQDRKTVNLLWNELINEVKDQSVDSIVMACTDLSILNNVTEPELKIYDSSEALAKSVVKKYLKG